MKMSEAASTVTSMNDDPRPYMKIAGQLRDPDHPAGRTHPRGAAGAGPSPTMSRTTRLPGRPCGKALRMLEDEGRPGHPHPGPRLLRQVKR